MVSMITSGFFQLCWRRPDVLTELTSEGVGFEPTVTHATLVFKTNTIDHSDTLPDIL